MLDWIVQAIIALVFFCSIVVVLSPRETMAGRSRGVRSGTCRSC